MEGWVSGALEWPGRGRKASWTTGNCVSQVASFPGGLECGAWFVEGARQRGISGFVGACGLMVPDINKVQESWRFGLGLGPSDPRKRL